MNANLLAIVKQIIATHGEDILSDPQRVKALFSDLAKDEPKSERIAFGRCVEHGFFQILKNSAATERDKCKQQLSQRLHVEEGLDLNLCANSVDLLATALFNEQQRKNYCKSCGKELQARWEVCPYCSKSVAKTNQANTSSISSGLSSAGDVMQTMTTTPIVVTSNKNKLTSGKKFFIIFAVIALLIFIVFIINNTNKPKQPSVITDVKIKSKYSYVSDRDALIGILTDIIEIDTDILNYISLFELTGIFRRSMFEEDQEIENFLKYKYGKEVKNGEAIKIDYLYKGEKDGFDFIYKPYNKDIFSQNMVTVNEFVTLLEIIEMDNR